MKKFLIILIFATTFWSVSGFSALKIQALIEKLNTSSPEEQAQILENLLANDGYDPTNEWIATLRLLGNSKSPRVQVGVINLLNKYEGEPYSFITQPDVRNRIERDITDLYRIYEDQVDYGPRLAALSAILSRPDSHRVEENFKIFDNAVRSSNPYIWMAALNVGIASVPANQIYKAYFFADRATEYILSDQFSSLSPERKQRFLTKFKNDVLNRLDTKQDKMSIYYRSIMRKISPRKDLMVEIDSVNSSDSILGEDAEVHDPVLFAMLEVMFPTRNGHKEFS
jgi:hypothetical protein